MPDKNGESHKTGAPSIGMLLFFWSWIVAAGYSCFRGTGLLIGSLFKRQKRQDWIYWWAG
jgi:hypothetical protein